MIGMMGGMGMMGGGMGGMGGGMMGGGMGGGCVPSLRRICRGLTQSGADAELADAVGEHHAA